MHYALSFEAELAFEVEPTKENIDPLAQLASLLELFKQNPWESPQDRYDPPQQEILQKQVEVNEVLPVLQGVGVNVFVGAYPAQKQIPCYDFDTGEMYVSGRTRFTRVQMGIVVVSDTTSTHLVRQPVDIEPNDEEEIPF